MKTPMSDQSGPAQTQAKLESSQTSDSRIAQLEQALEEEERESTNLRREIKDLNFRLEILEKSYAKQLEDERLRMEAAEKRAAEQGVRLVELDAARQDAIELLTEANAELERLANERNQLRRQLASRDGWQVEGADDVLADEGTINTLLDDARWASAREEKETEERFAPELEQPEEEPSEELIAPDLVFAANQGKD